jgi:hypothetical protein
MKLTWIKSGRIFNGIFEDLPFVYIDTLSPHPYLTGGR